MTTFKQAMETAGLRPVDFRRLIASLHPDGYMPPAATISRWTSIEFCHENRGAYDYALALVNFAAKCPNTARDLIGK